MEVRVDAVKASSAPMDTYLSVRVGDVQKQSRFADSRTYRFPKSSHGPGEYGRLEVFKRIGHMTVKLDELDGGMKEVDVPCDFPGMKKLSLRLGAEDTSKDTLPQLKTASNNKAKARKDAAQKYLDEYDLEDVLAEAMKELIHIKPRDPHAFLSERILSRRHHISPTYRSLPDLHSPVSKQRPTTGEKLPPLSLPVPQMPPKAAPAPAPAAAPVAVVGPQGFGAYYKEHMPGMVPQSVYTRFPVAARKTEAKPVEPTKPAEPAKAAKPPAKLTEWKGFYQENVRALDKGALHALYSKFPAAAGRLTPTPAPVPEVSFSQKPSVGTWLTPKPVTRWTAPVVEAVAEAAPTADVPPQARAFKTLPSVGTWLSRPIAVKKDAGAAATPAPVAAAPRQWSLKPSVGTWLMRVPAKAPDESILDRRPSELEALSKETLIAAVLSELEEKDREIEELKRQLDRMKAKS